VRGVHVTTLIIESCIYDFIFACQLQSYTIQLIRSCQHCFLDRKRNCSVGFPFCVYRPHLLAMLCSAAFLHPFVVCACPAQFILCPTTYHCFHSNLAPDCITFLNAATAVRCYLVSIKSLP